MRKIKFSAEDYLAMFKQGNTSLLEKCLVDDFLNVTFSKVMKKYCKDDIFYKVNGSIYLLDIGSVFKITDNKQLAYLFKNFIEISDTQKVKVHDKDGNEIIKEHSRITAIKKVLKYDKYDIDEFFLTYTNHSDFYLNHDMINIEGNKYNRKYLNTYCQIHKTDSLRYWIDKNNLNALYLLDVNNDMAGFILPCK